MDPLLPITEFGLSAESKTAGARQVLEGRKRATTSLLAAYAFDREALPAVGRRSLVRDGRGRFVAIIEVTRVETRCFCDVDEAYALLESDSLEAWREAHRRYLGSECRRVGAEMNEDIEVVLEYFRLVQPLVAIAENGSPPKS